MSTCRYEVSVPEAVIAVATISEQSSRSSDLSTW